MGPSLAGVDPDLCSGHADEARITPLRAHKASGKKALIRYYRNTAMALSQYILGGEAVVIRGWHRG